ncbi:uncharacterized protein LOC129946165 [Eupeodes corollae]|uniref:uncharacterized protein LOC129946165 n=1 Tax=Eupeodes corollae TaxID=290404 RepID=UPI0024932EAC|nr:uncharacterized protein LOC129946165 [Eupeodes corollae]XP_055912221.1 uncharacterized protein LOC129946165 [Eupeodes corollae]XP_055912222.1 uncharacterized protein LOC129946165 [Eupeodes corollae]
MNCDETGIQNNQTAVVAIEGHRRTPNDGNEINHEIEYSDVHCSAQRLSTDESAGSAFEIVNAGGSSCERPRTKPPSLDIAHRQGSGSSTKTCEADCGEERDTFSPISTNSSPSEHPRLTDESEIHKCNGGIDVDNKLFESKAKHPIPSAISTTKEEKQRQNEEIVIMETSSVSSETGSWESIFPNHGKITEADLRKCCNDFLQNERQNYCGGIEKPPSVTACFIDASSLRDEEEEQLAFTSQETAVLMNNIVAEPLETFQQGFKFCKTNRPKLNEKKEENSKSNSSSDESPQKVDDTDQINNLSDEEKLSRKRDKTKCNDPFGARSSTRLYEPAADDKREERDSSSSSSDSNEAVIMRKAKERKQGQFVFQHNIQQFSGHMISPKIPFTNDISYTTDYSSSSPAASLVWSSDLERNQKSSCMLPDTPHNSIVQVHARVDYRDSGAYCSDATDSPIPAPRTPKRFSKFDEANPIVSGGASIKDFNVKQCESPPVRRKTESCPIVSGGFMSLDFERANNDDEEFKIKPKMRKSQAPGVSSWVVDMSDCKNRKDSSSSSSGDTMSKSGFFVSLENYSANDEKPIAVERKKSFSDNTKKPQGFYVDLSEDDDSRNATPPPSLNNPTQGSRDGNDKKNIFSMFIDFGEKKLGSKKEPLSLAARLSSSFNLKRSTNDELMKSSTSSTETLMSKSSHQPHSDSDHKGEDEFKKHAIEPLPTTVAAIRRISKNFTSSSDPKRHSWANNSNNTVPSADCKRSMSLTGDKGLMNIIDKIPLISKTSSLSVDSSLSPFDDLTSSKSEIGSTYSNTSTTSGSVPDNVGVENANHIPGAAKVKKHRRDVQLNETFDKSSVASLTDGVLSKDLSPISTGTDTEDLTFQQEEEGILHDKNEPSSHQQIKDLTSRSLVMETIIEAKETSSPKKSASNYSSTHTMESLNATIEKQKQLLETVTENAVTESRSFVKLSDMDKPLAKFELHSPSETMSKSVGNHRQINRLFHDTSRARPHSWTMSRSTGPSILNITNSVDNLKSLSRLFPQFSKELSCSLPNDFVGNVEHMDYVNSSDFSINSSLASSFSRSGMDESSISCRQPRRLGEDLLKMFLQELATDMTVEVNGRRIKAHKCILRSRCQYFAAMLAGGWAQSSGNVVSLPGYSFSAVHFALCHIYSGASHPPDGISLMELAALADLLGLEGLKEVTAHALKSNYCHNFHKPCSGCIDGILQVLPVALNHALDDLYRKCLKWTCRHYLKVWPTRSFAQLPSDILYRCRQQIVAYLTSETVLDSVLDCDNLLAQLAPFRWASVIEKLVRDILDVAYGYISDHFSSLIASDSFLSLGHDKSCHIPRLESLLLRTASSLTPDQACRSYQRITRLNTVLSAKILKMPNLGELAKELQGLHEEELEWNEEFIRLISAILSTVEQCLTRQCSRAMRVNAWQRMDLELRKKIQTLARLTEPVDLRRGKSVTKAFSFGGSSNRNQDLYQFKLAIQAHSKRSLANDSQLFKATTHTQTHAQDHSIQTAERGVQANNDVNENKVKIVKTNSRAHVPLITKQQQTHHNASEKSSSHRRTQSEASAIRISGQKQVKNIPEAATEKPIARLTEVRPRYLEPRKPRGTINTNGPVRSQTSSSIPSTLAKGKHISSSDSSRNSSPAIRRNNANSDRKIGTKSINMSLDSLASPSRKAKPKGKSSNPDVCVDSLADSMKSSMITDKTVSQESLAGGKLSRSNPVISNKIAVRQLKNQAAPKVATNRPLAKGRQISSHNTTSAGSSPSSLTNKSGSRLSSVSSVNSPRDAFKNRSISVPGNQSTASTGQPTPTVARKSFLSAKSREILARRAEKNKQQQQQQQSSSGEEKSHSTISSSYKPQPLLRGGIGRESMPLSNRNSHSNIPTRRPNSLHLKKTYMSDQRTQNNQYQESQKSKFKFKNPITNGNGNDNSNSNSNTIELHIESSPKETTKCNRIETKLERSSTFCKESSDLLMDELQIIE